MKWFVIIWIAILGAAATVKTAAQVSDDPCALHPSYRMIRSGQAELLARGFRFEGNPLEIWKWRGERGEVWGVVSYVAHGGYGDDSWNVRLVLHIVEQVPGRRPAIRQRRYVVSTFAAPSPLLGIMYTDESLIVHDADGDHSPEYYLSYGAVEGDGYSQHVVIVANGKYADAVVNATGEKIWNDNGILGECAEVCVIGNRAISQYLASVSNRCDTTGESNVERTLRGPSE
ncbi:MAG: hypothetical protein ABIR47_02425, partial [Candidatus Kapaibacterium sp.]